MCVVVVALPGGLLCPDDERRHLNVFSHRPRQWLGSRPPGAWHTLQLDQGPQQAQVATSALGESGHLAHLKFRSAADAYERNDPRADRVQAHKAGLRHFAGGIAVSLAPGESPFVVGSPS